MKSKDSGGKLPITVLILTKNEEKAIVKCLKSVAEFDQVIVVDSNSSDATKTISRNLGAQVVNFSWNGRYPKKKQWSKELELIRNEWILYLDADERVSQELLSELKIIFKSDSPSNFSAFEVSLRYKFLGKTLLHGHRVKKVALIKGTDSFFPEIDDLIVQNMWEVEGHYQPITAGEIKRLSGTLIHDDPDPLFEYFERHNKYSDWETELKLNPKMQKQVRGTRTRQGKLFDRIPFKSIIFFIYSFFVRAGWRDGLAGFHYSLALSFYYWQISVKVKERRLHEKFE